METARQSVYCTLEDDILFLCSRQNVLYGEPQSCTIRRPKPRNKAVKCHTWVKQKYVHCLGGFVYAVARPLPSLSSSKYAKERKVPALIRREGVDQGCRSFAAQEIYPVSGRLQQTSHETPDASCACYDDSGVLPVLSHSSKPVSFLATMMTGSFMFRAASIFA